MGKATISRNTIAKGVTAGIVAVASLGILQAGNYQIPPEETNTEANVAPEGGTAEAGTTPAAQEGSQSGTQLTLPEAPYSFTPGTYTASAKGISSDISVTCTFDETSITAMEADVSGETQGIGTEIGTAMIESILSAQTPQVDGISGATISSDALKAAVADCFMQAAGLSTGTPAAAEGSTEAAEAGTEAAEKTTEADTEAAEKTTEAGTEAAQDATEAAAGTDSTAPSGAGYTPGTYTASAKGISSDITVTVTFDETSITALEADVSGETQGIGTEVGDDLSAAILEAQSAEVDGVAGATITSDALKTAAADCIAQASAGGAAEPAANADTEGVSEAETEVGSESASEAETELGSESASEAETELSSESASEAETELSSESTSEAETELGSESASEAETELATGTASAAGGALTVAAPGTYTASAKGISSDVTATCTFDGSALTAVEVDVSGETAGIGADIGDTMVKRFLDAQSSEVDAVSGATITSDALKSAVADCFGQAGAVAAAPAQEAETEAQTEAADADGETTGEEDREVLYIPGTYTATVKGMESDVSVTCTFDEYGIVSIGVYVAEETETIGAKIGGEISDQLMAAQSAEVDGVAGATVTSDAVKAAAADCIAQALLSGASEAETEMAAEDTAETEAETAAEDADEAETEAAAENASKDGAETETAAKSASAPLTAGSGYVPGIYSASMKGISSDVRVTMSFSEDGITSVGVIVSGETPGIGADIGDEMQTRLLTAQSADIDGISGATITSDAVKGAAAECIAKATFTE